MAAAAAANFLMLSSHFAPALSSKEEAEGEISDVEFCRRSGHFLSRRLTAVVITTHLSQMTPGFANPPI